MGNGAGKLHLASSRVLADGHQAEDSPKNLNSYRITDTDRLGEGGPKQKFSQNLKAIEILRALDAENRSASPDEKTLLVKYVGWGGLPQVFDVDSTSWHREQIRLSEMLSDEEHRSARATTINAHYTAPVVIRAMYEAAQRFGFQGGQILEPASGIGHFIGLMPEAMLKKSAITGVEIDPLTARIAKALYPDADIREQPFEKSKLLDDSFDLAISNVPFGDYTVHDPRWNDFKFPIHDYFFAAALDKVRPGGLLMFVTSRHTLDKMDSSLRESLADRAEFLGAIRLPNTAFKKNAGREVTTDIVMLRKLRGGETPGGPAWKASVDFTNDQQEKFSINEYFATHPEMMLGKMRLARGMYRDGEPVLEPDHRELGEALAHAVARLPQNIYAVKNESVKTFDPSIPAPDYIKPNAYCVHEDGRLCLNEDGVLNPLDDLPVETRSRIRRLIDVRDAVRDCLRSQLDGSGEERLIESREKLNHAYDRFVSRFGYISVPVNQRAFHGDPDLPLLLSLENYDEETSRAVKASIFRERTIHHKQPVESVGSPKEALLVSLNEKGRVDLNHMASLLARPAADFLPDLKGMVFLNPETKQWETEDQYLSGNVREKLVAADSASVAEVRFRENVEALKSVQPADLPATEIDVRLGASWLPPSDVQDFVHGLLGVTSGVEVGHIHALGSWHVTADWEARGATANTTDWGTNRYTALELIEETLNLKTPTVYNYVDKKPVVDAQSTEAAREKQERIKERFKEWIWSDDSRRERLVRLYNDSFNHSRVRTFNGEHLTLPGASADVQLHTHQKAGVWRILQTPNTLLGHVVGAGKTYTMVASAMELKRLGLARKPMFAVPNLKRLGVPENEIAFIQDYDADNAKLALFRSVRAGKVRVLFGSTQKMGSGTNVQERLIALHHLDAPWRPADVEQREGRILRQGNKNASVQIYRYVTEGSFDAYMWQTLETKAKFIAQVMSGDMTIRRLEDMDSAALTYAEVKAIASGNPLVIEKAQVDAELIRLTRLRSAHAEEQYRIRSSVRHSHQEVQTWTERLANLREDLTLRQDTSGDKFRIELDKQTLDNRGVAGELLLRRAEKIKTRFGEDIRIGRFAGFDLFIRSGFNNTAELVLRGKNSYSTRVTDTALGTIRSLESTVQGFEERATRLESDIKDSQKRATELEAKVGSPFEKEERYHHLARRQSEIEEQLDLTKNQAPSQVDAATTDEREENSEKQTETKSIQQTRRAAVRV